MFYLLLPLFHLAQSAGLYLTASDFKNGTITGDHKTIKVRELFSGKKQVSYKQGDSVLRISKTTLYGFCDHHGNKFRYHGEYWLEILNDGESILIYRLARGTGLRGDPERFEYFFSKLYESEPIVLNLNNLLKSFSDEPGFCLALELYVHSESELLAYDNLHKIYKINRLLHLGQSLALLKN